MKYIKIENTILLEKDYLQGIIDGTVDRNKTVKVADTIEELCDEFVYCFRGENPILINEENIKQLALLRLLKYVYAGIWTDKGLIYVAKMNDKGELELL